VGKIKEQVDLLFPWKNDQTQNFPENGFSDIIP
jgi:hypothetical protein